MYCKNCGAQMPEDMQFCTSCGMSADQLPPVPAAPCPSFEEQPPAAEHVQPETAYVQPEPIMPRKKFSAKKLIMLIAASLVLVAMAVVLYLEVFTVRVFLRTYYKSNNDYGNSSTEYEYDDQGRLLEITEYEEGKRASVTKYEYDKKGNLIEETVVSYVEVEELRSRREYSYDSKNNMTESISYSYENGIETQTSRTEYSYDKKGNLSESTHYDASDNETSQTEYTYDKKGNLIATETYEDNQLARSEVYEYDKKGNETLYVNYLYDEDGQKNEWWRDEAVYDKKGNLLESTTYRNGELSSEFTYEYDKNGNRLKFTYIYYSDYYESGKVVYVDEYEYDEKGHLKKISYYSDGVKTSHKKVKCDKYGNTIEWISYNSEGTRDGTTTCKYTKLRMSKKKAEKLQETNDSYMIIDEGWF